MKIPPVSRSHLTKRQRSKHSENHLAKEFKGRRQPASGALPIASFKGDVITDHFLFDDKTTGAKSFSVSQNVLQKLARDAFGVKKVPVVRVRFEGSGRSYFVIDELTFKRLVHFLETD